MRSTNQTITALITLALAGCAGPTTPLGAPWATSSAEVRNGPLAFIASLFRTGTSQIQFEPRHQILHGPSPLAITITDPHGIKSNYRLVVRHNGLDVTPSFLRQAKTRVGKHQIRIGVPVLRLPADREHLIEVIYGAGGGATDLTAYARYQPPVCRAFEKGRTISSVPGFNPTRALIDQISALSRRRGVNPALTTGLIAQESGFNPRVVSWAKAIGLTQVTPLAETEILDQHAGWPQYPGLNEYPTIFVKALILSGQANPANEWRLDSEKSITGGLTYLAMLSERWHQAENLARVQALFEDTDVALTKLVLASYNSGFARVMAALTRLGPNWLTAPELKEARKYVNRISSYCDQFSQTSDSPEETSHEEET